MIVILILILCSYYIMKSCDSFELAANYLGRHMPNGMKGATLNAVGSSLPELMTTIFFLFLYHDIEGFSSGVATCAGSSIYNMIIIPGLCFLAVYFIGVYQKNHTERQTINKITVERQTLIRDGFFFILAQTGLIYVLSQNQIGWMSGVILLSSYILYLMVHFKNYLSHKKNYVPSERDDHAHEVGQKTHVIKDILTCNFFGLFFNRKKLNTHRAWVILSLSVTIMGVACYGLTEAINIIAQFFGIESFFAAIVLAAAATSIPDTILSIKDALNGKFDDAFSNAFGSNIFNITIGIGLPLLCYSLIFGPIIISSGDLPVRSLQIFIFLASLITFATFLSQHKIGIGKISLLLCVYIVWIIFVVSYAFEIKGLLSLFSWIFQL